MDKKKALSFKEDADKLVEMEEALLYYDDQNSWSVMENEIKAALDRGTTHDEQTRVSQFRLDTQSAQHMLQSSINRCI